MLMACRTGLRAELFVRMSKHPPPSCLVGAVSLSSAITHMVSPGVLRGAKGLHFKRDPSEQ